MVFYPIEEKIVPIYFGPRPETSQFGSSEENKQLVTPPSHTYFIFEIPIVVWILFSYIFCFK